MTYVWEEEYLPRSATAWAMEWHLKHIVGKSKWNHDLKISVAYIRKLGDRKYRVVFQTNPAFITDNKTLRSLKAAKAYALAIITLDT